MKYTIEGFSQEYSLSLSKIDEDGKTIKLDVIDLVILRWFVDFYPKMEKIQVNGESYAIIKFSYLEQQLPLLDISKRAFSDRMRKMSYLDILKYEFINNNIPTYTFGANYCHLISNEGCAKNEGGSSSNNEGVVVQTTTYSSIYNSSNNIYIGDSQKKLRKETKIEEITKQLLELYNSQGLNSTYQMTKNKIDLVNKRLKQYSLEQISLSIERYGIVYRDTNYYFNHEYTFDNFFERNSVIKDFLDEGSKWVAYQSSIKNKDNYKNYGYNKPQKPSYELPTFN